MGHTARLCNVTSEMLHLVVEERLHQSLGYQTLAAVYWGRAQAGPRS